MNFRAIGLKMAVATAVATGAAVTSAPAQAYDLYSSTLRFESPALFNENTDVFDFRSGALIIDDGQTAKDFETFGAANTPIAFKDLQLVQTSSTTWSLGSVLGGGSFITGLANGITFQLNSFDLSFDGIGQSGGKTFRNYSATLAGIFFSPKYLDGVPTLDGTLGQIQFKTTGSASGSMTTIPTPALLPGLAGLALAAIRKRKDEVSEEVDA